MKVLINGIGGRMGQVLLSQIAKLDDIEAVAGLDVAPCECDIPCYTDFSDIKEDFDCVIDFSFHTGTPKLLANCVKVSKPIVVCTTGHTEDELESIHDAAKHIPVFFSMNMSLGVALLCELAKKTVAAFPDADIEIIETHHNRKADSPSGTAIMIANAIKTVREGLVCVLGRNGMKKRQKNDIGIHSVRMGNVVGEHTVIVGTDNQTITLKHQAHDRALFADGAVSAARFLVNRNKGLYNMDDIIN